jgi:hypothetical protein
LVFDGTIGSYLPKAVTDLMLVLWNRYSGAWSLADLSGLTARLLARRKVAKALTERLTRLERQTGLIEQGEHDEDYDDDDRDMLPEPDQESGTGRLRWASDR